MGIWRALGDTGFRWLHVLAGITWIGLLYYFNFVQTPSLAKFDAAHRIEVQRKLLPTALLWFRMAAATTFATGIFILLVDEDYKGSFFKSWQGLGISAGMLIATVMMLNVWLVIWPNQKVVIANAEGLAAGKDADPAAAPAGRKAALASRTNVVFSIPVLWFMVGTSHLLLVAPRFYSKLPSGADKGIWFLALLILTAVFEANALGLLGGFDPSPIRKFLDDQGQTIAIGFGLWAVFLILQLALS
jgi:uncharacterized membrane protein